MNKIVKIALPIVFLIALIGCGESAKQRQERETAEAKHRADSIALVEKKKAELEQQRADSLANLEKRRERLAADSATRADLLPLFLEEKNIPTEGMVTYKAKTAPQRHGQNTIYLTFYADNGVAKGMSATIDYAGSDWIYLQSVNLDVDGEDFSLTQGDDKGDKITDSLLWEWFTTEVGSNLINKLEDAKSIRLRYNGEDRKKEIGLTPAQVKAMANTVKLYKAMGGQ